MSRVDVTKGRVTFVAEGIDHTLTVSAGEFAEYRGGARMTWGLSDQTLAIKQDDAGLVAIEAEDAHAIVSVGRHTWAPFTEADGLSGGRGMRAVPNVDSNVQERAAPTLSPRMDYRIVFLRAGIHYVWVRGSGTSQDNSIHLGLDGQIAPLAKRIYYPRHGPLIWTNTDREGRLRPVRVDVPSKGVRTINVWMREDGVVVDRIELTPQHDYRPQGHSVPKTEVPGTRDYF